MRPLPDPTRWRRIASIFSSAIDLPPAERTGFLRDACGDDPGIRIDVERLLAHDDDHAGVLDGPALSIPETAWQDPDVPRRGCPSADDLLGHSIGPYRLVERIATGGMGVVYRGVRNDDATLRYQVALKVVRRGLAATWDNPDRVTRRFLAERQTLANLAHPNIARLFDGGTTEDGLPYLVMEFIDGHTIDVYCDEHRLTVPERLRLFMEVCDAVHCAHQNLVVHRDLKPGNILVTPAGRPKLLDFGISTVLDRASEGDVGPPRDSNARPADSTATFTCALTPDYASPEQVRGDPVTTATDVYSLGVVLYELLTGARPFRTGSGRLSEIEREICEREPTRPSTAVVRRREAGVSNSTTTASGQNNQALAGTAGHGGDTAEEIATARGTTPARLRRELRGDLDTIVLTALRKEPQRRYASAAQLAEDVQRALEGLPLKARETLRSRARKFIRRNRIAVVAAAMIALSLAAGAVVSAWMARVAARERDSARLAEVDAARDAAHARIEAASASETSRFLTSAFLTATTGRTDLELAQARRTLTAEAARVRRQFAGQPHLQANLFDALGRVNLNLGFHDEAATLLEEAARLRESKFGPESLEFALSLDSMGELSYARGHFPEAERYFRRALQLQRTSPPGVHTDVALAANNLAATLRSMGRLDEAELLHLEALALRRAKSGDRDPLVAESLNNIAVLRLSRGRPGDFEAAATGLREALDIRRAALGDQHPLVAQTLSNLGAALRSAGDLVGAEPCYRDAVSLSRSQPHMPGPELARALNGHGETLRGLGRLSEAAEALREALDIARQGLGPDHPTVGNIVANLAAVATARGDEDDAEALWREALRIRQAALPAGHPAVVAALVGLSEVLLARGVPKAAEPLLQEALAISKDTVAPHAAHAQAEAALGMCLLSLARPEEAREHLQAACEIWQRLRGEDAEETRRACAMLERLEADVSKSAATCTDNR